MFGVFVVTSHANDVTIAGPLLGEVTGHVGESRIKGQ